MIEDFHDAQITPETIIPPWYGERLDLDYAIWVCFANAANQASRHGNGPPPVPGGPGYHSIRVEVGVPGAKVFSRPGYWLTR